MSSTYARISHAILGGRRFNDLLAKHHSARTDAWAVWTFCQLVSTKELTDGRVYRHQLAVIIDPDRMDVAIRALCDVGLLEMDGEHVVVLADFSEHNHTRAEVEAIREKRIGAGSKGGKRAQSLASKQKRSKHRANDSGLLASCSNAVEANSEHAVSASASASAFVSVPDPERATPSPPPDRPPLTVTVADPEDAPAALPNELAAQALVAGYREAYRAEHRGIPPTDADRWSVPAGAREAFWHSTDATKPSELRDHAERVASAWFRSRKSRAHPAFSFFLKDLARLLAEGAGAPPMRLVAVTEPEVADAS